MKKKYAGWVFPAILPAPALPGQAFYAFWPMSAWFGMERMQNPAVNG